jgi:hypothetical protein
MTPPFLSACCHDEDLASEVGLSDFGKDEWRPEAFLGHQFPTPKVKALEQRLANF